MANKYEVEATARDVLGKGASRRLRHEEMVPGIVYGGGKNPIPLKIEHKKIAKSLENEGFYSHILMLNLDAEKERVILKDVQRHPFKARITHVDFQRVRADEKLHMHIPLHFLNNDKAPGLKEGGLISHIVTDVEISCLPDDLPEYLEIDVGNMQLNAILHLSDIKLPKGVEIVALSHQDDKPIVSLHMPRIEEEPDVSAEPVSAEVPAMAQKSEAEIAAEASKKDDKK